MFTGIVEELGQLRARDGSRFVFAAARVLEDAEVGASIAVNGCCLTVEEIGPDWFRCHAVAETLGRTSLGDLAAGDRVNLERPVRVADRLGGHLVQGHVDAVGIVAELDLADVPPTSHPLDLVNVWAEDEPHESLPLEDVLANAPAAEGRSFRVPPWQD